MVEEGENIVVTGNGGAGKTFFMRHAWMTMFRAQSRRTPIFIELRRFNEITQVDLPAYIRRCISSDRNLTDEIFSYFCKKGRFCFLLDGFDEVSKAKRDKLQEDILGMSTKFPECSFVVSSRGENRFAGWQNFQIFESLPFNYAQVRELVEKVPFDKEAKKRFLGKLDDNFYQANQSFLSNPLLAIMMMMTFRENMDIPRVMVTFYDQAFNTLFQWHDATKAYNRTKSLDIGTFQRSFGAFCLLSYYKEIYDFSRSEIIELIRISNKLNSIEVSCEDILHDYEEAVNLIRQDGLRYVFIHRSFQEYFAALAMIRYFPEKFTDFLPEIKKRVSDSVLFMCFELDRNMIVQEYIKA